jgi:hypothetical protein
MSTPRDDYGARHIVGAPGCLFVLGAVLPSLWAIWVVVRIGVANSSLWGQQTTDPTYPRGTPELWTTAGILTLTAIALLGMLLRYPTARRRTTRALTVLTLVAAVANWAILLLP